jgi:hypothetical protein
VKASLRRWRALSLDERLTFLQALLLLPIAGLVLRLARYQSILSVLQRITPLKEWSSPAEPLPEAQRMAAMVNAAAWRAPYEATCLRRSLLLWWLLRRRGLESSVRIGVRIEAGAFYSHAWVEFEDTVLNDAPDVRTRYATIL